MSPEKSIFDRPEFSPLSLAQTGWRQKVPILSTWVLLSAIAVFVVRAMPPVYQAEAVILLEAQRIPTNFVSPTIRTDLQDRLSSLRQQVLSHTRLSEMIETFSLYREEAETATEEAIVAKMRKDIFLEIERGYANQPPAFRVGYQGATPEVVYQVTNRLANLFLNEDVRLREVEATSTAQFLDNQLDAARKSLEEQEGRLSSYKKAYNGQLPQQEGALQATLSRLSQQVQADREALRQAQQERSLAETSLEGALSALRELRVLIQSASANTAGASAAESKIPLAIPPRVQDPTLVGLRERLNTLRSQYTENHPDVVRAVEALNQYQEHVANQELARPGTEGASTGLAPVPPSSANSQLVAVLAPDVRQREEQISELRRRMSALDSRIQTLTVGTERRQQEMAEVEGTVRNLPLREQDLAAVVRDYEISRTNYQSLLQKKMDADLATEMERRQKSERFVLLDPPRMPVAPIKPNKPLFALAGSMFGLICGVLVGFGREIKNNVFLGEWELPAGVNVLGRVPEFAVDAAGTGLISGTAGPKSASTIRSTAQRSLSALALIAVVAVQTYRGGGLS